ncbi:MAG: hypothetical protein DHS20C18_00590 [Saprospiraceae bacterium]|nr:MAG: hypothetical protein DHS20C18_00590 [Saprospiraceae bacterium]
MAFVSEEIIDGIAGQFGEDGAAYEKAVEALQQHQPILLGYLFSENFEAFTQEEREFMLYLLLVIWYSYEKVHGTIPVITEALLEEADEKNWTLINEVRGGRFRDRLDVFFDQTTQEDLLAFVEDALAEDEDQLVTAEGREAIFITLKSIIDCLQTSV